MLKRSALAITATLFLAPVLRALEGQWYMSPVSTGVAGADFAVRGGTDPVVAYTATPAGCRPVKLARWSVDQWVTENVDAAGCAMADLSFAIDAAGDPAVVYLLNATGDIRLARKSAGTWSYETVARTSLSE